MLPNNIHNYIHKQVALQRVSAQQLNTNLVFAELLFFNSFCSNDVEVYFRAGPVHCDISMAAGATKHTCDNTQPHSHRGAPDLKLSVREGVKHCFLA